MNVIVCGIVLIAILFSQNSFSYPDLSRHGYTNCTACHLSPSGGGLLTSYGRELSKEVLSTWGKDGEQYFAYGKISHDENVLLGAYIRGLQAYREDENKKDARFILMQADIEAGYDSLKWAVAASLGRQEIRAGQSSEGRLFTRRFYALYRPDEKWNLRVGKFLRFYGLNDPNHYMYVRKDLNFGFDTETYNVEASFLGDNWNFYFTYSDGNLARDKYAMLKDQGGTVSMSYFFLDKEKVGLSLYHGEDETNRRWVFGPSAILSFSSKWFLLAEFDWQSKDLKSTQGYQQGYVTSSRLNYEWIQGLISFVSYDKKFLNQDDANTEQQSYGVGMQFFPRPHLEAIATWQKEEVIASRAKSDLVWLLLHFYL